MGNHGGDRVTILIGLAEGALEETIIFLLVGIGAPWVGIGGVVGARLGSAFWGGLERNRPALLGEVNIGELLELVTLAFEGDDLCLLILVVREGERGESIVVELGLTDASFTGEEAEPLEVGAPSGFLEVEELLEFFASIIAELGGGGGVGVSFIAAEGTDGLFLKDLFDGATGDEAGHAEDEHTQPEEG